MVQADIERILSFWIDEIGSDGWFEQSAALDARIRNDFLGHWHEAMAGQLEDWMATPDGALALIILLDQFPRNMFRGEAAAFRSDPYALSLAKRAIACGFDKKTPEPHRQFFYVPLMHSEKLADQERCVRMIMLGLPETGDKPIAQACKHREVIRKFGRFPSRNAALGRSDTPAERAYRAAGGYMA